MTAPQTKRSVFLSLLVAFCLLAPAPAWTSADDVGLNLSAEAAPDGFSEAVRAVLSGEGHTISIAGVPTATMWFRSQLPQTNTGEPDLGVSYGTLLEAVLVGAVRLDTRWKDYKGNSIADGLYTMRYAIQPADGNHMGVSIYRDFLLLIPAASDPDPAAEFDHDTVVEMSMKGLTHPSVLALFPVWDSVEAPTLQKNDMDQWMLATPFGALNLGLTVTGQGEH